MANKSQFPNVYRLRDDGRENLIKLLATFPGKKDLVIDADLMRPMDRIAGASLFKENQVDKIYKLEAGKNISSGCNQRIYLIRPNIPTIEDIANQILDERSKYPDRRYKLIMTPRKLHICDLILEQQGVYGYVTTDQYQLDIIPLDRDILSLQLPEFFKSFYFNGDQTWLQTVANSIANLLSLFGQIPNTYCIGRGSKMVHDLVQTVSKNYGTFRDIGYEIGNLFIVDRDVDFVTPLCSQLTYEGLLDEEVGIDSGYIEFGKEVTGKDQTIKYLLTYQDEVFESTRNRHFANVFSFLSRKAKEIQTGYDKSKSLSTVGDIKDFVANDLRSLDQTKKALAYHIGACEAIMNKKAKADFEEYLRCEHSMLEVIETKENTNYIEECINRQFNPTLTLRLMCILSLTLDGIPTKDYKSLKQQYLQSHGYDHIQNFFSLKKLGLLGDVESLQQSSKSSGLTKIASLTKSSYQSFCRRLNLIPKNSEHINLQSPDDMSYVFSGAFTPIICRLVERVLQKDGFSGMEDVISLIPGGVHSDCKAKSAKGKGGKASSREESDANKTVLVYFLGGCTYSEIAALRLLGQTKGFRFLIATTNVTNGNKLLSSILTR